MARNLRNMLINSFRTRPWTVKSISCAAVRRIVMNLVRNAFKFTQNGYIIVSLKTQSAENLGSKLQDTNSHIVLGVEDSVSSSRVHSSDTRVSC